MTWAARVSRRRAPQGARLARRLAPRSARSGLVALLFALGCQQSPTPKATRPAVVESPRLQQLRAAESVGDAREVREDDLASRDLAVRRRSARLLARVADASARAGLERLLGDEDIEVVSWAAFGLGRGCATYGAQPTVARLVARATSLVLAGPLARAPLGASSVLESPSPALSLADALGRCGGDQAEGSLRAWLELEPRWAEAAALGLGRLASSAKHLEETTLVALLERAEARPPVATALYPFSRLSELDAPVVERLLAVVNTALGKGGDARRYALRALPLGGPGAVPLLERVLLDPARFDDAERSDAARALGKLGTEGQTALGRALGRLAWRADQVSESTVVSKHWGPMLEILESLHGVPSEARVQLEQLADTPTAQGSTPAMLRRLVVARCRAAALLADRAFTAPRLLSCDPVDNGREGQLALLRVLERGSLLGARGRRFAQLASEGEPTVRIAALRTLRQHPEFPEPAGLLTAALGAESSGVVATAALLLADQPERAGRSVSERAGRSASERHKATKQESAPPALELLAAVETALTRAFPPDALEVRANLMDAVVALGLLRTKPVLQKYCSSPQAMLREHAEHALRRFGEPERRCEAPEPAAGAVTALPRSLQRVRFETDVGPLELTLDPELAPLAVTRLLELLRSGFYDGLSVHRVVPGFVVQLGDKAGDGYGGAGRAALRSEPSPTTFAAGSVGLALSGPDSASSQFFVTLGPYPHLAGDHATVGRASGGWERLTVGDRVISAKILP